MISSKCSFRTQASFEFQIDGILDNVLHIIQSKYDQKRQKKGTVMNVK